MGDLSDWRDVYGVLADLWGRGDLEASAAVLDEYRSQLGDTPLSKLARAQQLRLTSRPGDQAKAVELVREAVEPQESHPDFLITAVLLAFELGERGLVDQYIRQLQPYDSELHALDFAALQYVKGRVALEAGRRDEAEALFRTSSELDPNFQEYRDALLSLLERDLASTDPAPLRRRVDSSDAPRTLDSAQSSNTASYSSVSLTKH